MLWGRPTEQLLRALTPDELGFARPVRLVQVGARAGDTIALPAAAVWTSGVEIVGAATGLTPETMAASYQQVVDWAKDGDLVFNVETAPLSQIETAWSSLGFSGKRLVVLAG